MSLPPVVSLGLMLAIGTTADAQVPANAPPDRPVSVAVDCQWRALLKAIAPLEARARETFPAARERFLLGLPPNQGFYITIRLTDSLAHREQVFVAVDSMVGHRITGRLASDISVVRGYRNGQRISVADSDLVDWMIALPDGSEEGNLVGKFMDAYTPPKDCRQPGTKP